MMIKLAKDNCLTEKQYESMLKNLCRAGYIVTPYLNKFEIKKNEEFEW